MKNYKPEMTIKYDNQKTITKNYNQKLPSCCQLKKHPKMIHDKNSEMKTMNDNPEIVITCDNQKTTPKRLQSKLDS